MAPKKKRATARARELLKTAGGKKRYIRRDELGRFTTDQVDVGRSLSRDRQQKAKTVAKKGHGDRKRR